MSIILQTIGHRFRQRPLRTLLVLLSVAFGSAVIALSGSVQAHMWAAIEAVADRGGTVVSIANGNMREDGSMERTFPSEFRKELASAVKNDLPFITDISPVNSMAGQVVRIGENRYRVRTSLGTGSSYADVFGLSFIYGSFFDEEDAEQANRVAVISRATATALFGAPEHAVGKKFELLSGDVTIVIRRNGVRETQVLPSNTFEIIGVFEDPADFRRRTWDIADLIIPFSTQFPAGLPMGEFVQAFVAGIKGTTPEEAAPLIADSIRRNISEDTAVSVWEGGPQSPGGALNDAREGISRNGGLMSALGYLILLISLFGIFSTMLVEVVDRRREIGIRRSLGAAYGRVVLEVGIQSALLTTIGAVGGVGLTLLFGTPILEGLDTFLEAVGARIAAAEFDPFSLGLSVLIAAAGGFAFGIVPGIQAAKLPIVESLKD